jgi:superfamily II DNA or RNA helicase
MGTGIGKSKTAIDCAMWHEDNVQACDTLIVCHSEGSRDTTWPQQLQEWAGDHAIAQAERVCYPMLPKIKDRRLRVILDEAHKLTPRHWQFFKDNQIVSLILLTATQPRDEEKRRMLRELVGGNRFDKTADEAIDDGILNDYNIYQYIVQLDNREKYCEVKPGVLETELEAYIRLCARKNYFERENNYQMAKQTWLDIMRFLGTTKTKTKVAEYIIRKLREKNRRFIVFCKSQEQAEALSPYPYHSGMSDINFQRMLRMEINELASVDQIQEGANIPELDRAVNIQLNSDPLPIIQRTGRLLRREVGSTSTMFLITMDKTFDVKWTLKALSKTPKHKINSQVLDRQLYWPI